MPTNILIDLNVILDVFLERLGYQASGEVIQKSEQDGTTLYISAHMLTTFGYLLEHAKVPHTLMLEHIKWLLNTFIVIPTDNVLLRQALKSSITDYEDAVAEQAAVSAGCRVIITRNLKDFKASVPSLTPEQFLQVV